MSFSCNIFKVFRIKSIFFNSEIKRLLHTSKMPFYAVAKGRKPGIYNTWSECEVAVKGIKYAKYKKFDTEQQAREFINMFNGKVVEPTSKIKLKEANLKSQDEIEDDIFNTELIEKIDLITEEYKSKVVKEIANYKSSIASSSSRKFSTSTNTHSKRKYSSDSNDDSSNKIPKVKVSDENVNLEVDKMGYAHVFTDGACENNGKVGARAGLGVWFGPDHPLNVSEPVKGRPTNNVGEIQACTRAIQIAHSAGVKKLCINTDSQFVINSMTNWIKGWKSRGWKLKDGGPVKNKDDFIELDRASKLLELKWNYVKGHANIEGNEEADKLARDGAKMFR